MWYRLKRTVICLLAVIALSTSSTPAQAGWGRHWGHHHGFYGGYYSSSISWGFPGYSYSSFYVGRPRLFHPYRVGYYSSYYAPSVSYTVSLPTYYYATPTYYVAPTYYAVPTYYSAPVVYPSVNCCDPCASSVSYPSAASPTVAPTYSQPEYSTGIDQQQSYVRSPQVASTGGSFVDRMLGRSTSIHPSTNHSAPTPVYMASSSDGSVRTVSTLKPVVASTSIPASIDQLTPIPEALLKTADEMFALGGYEQAASAYARLAVRYGDHDQLAVRRFIALIASGDHSQASIVYELAMVNGRPLTASALPVGGLAKLYGSSAQNRKNHIESLAAYALKSDNEAMPLRMVGTWLELDGQSERAVTFIQRAEMISLPPEATPAPAVANRLVGAQLAR